MDNEFYEVDTERADDFFAHHGIVGMKWGHQNGPPYPLSAGEHNKVIEKGKARIAAEKAAEAAGKAVMATGRAVEKVGSATEKAVMATGKAVEKLGSGVSKTAQKIKESHDAKQAKKDEQQKQENEKSREEYIRSLTAKSALQNREQFSDAELNRIMNRLQTEARIRELDNSYTARGRKAAERILGEVATQTVKDIAKAATKSAVEQAFDKAVDKSTGKKGENFIKKASENYSKSQKGKEDKTVHTEAKPTPIKGKKKK